MVAMPKMDEGPIWRILDYFAVTFPRAKAQPRAVRGGVGDGLTVMSRANHLQEAAATKKATMPRIEGEASMS